MGGLPHPRLYGTSARVLGHFVRERGLTSLGPAVAKMTGAPAGRLGIAGRGTLEAGAAADIVVFDPASIHDKATYVDPRHHPSGIEHVLVNGIAAGSVGAGAVAGRGSER